MHLKVNILFFYGLVGITAANIVSETWNNIVEPFNSVGNALIKTWKIPYEDRRNDWKKECGCDDTDYPEILVVKKKPVKCVCMITGYEIKEPPGGNDYTTVYNTFQSISILNVNHETKTLSLNIILSYMWEDTRLNATSPDKQNKIDFPGVSPKQKLPIWQPSRSRYLSDNKDEMTFVNIGFLLNNSLTRDATLVRAILSWRMKVKCNLDFTSFPFDHQACKFRLNSKDSGDLKEVLYGHENQTMVKLANVGTLDIMATIIGSHSTEDECTEEIGIDIEMKRQIQVYIFEYYIPSMAIVSIASISFIIPVYAIPGRISLVVTLLLTQINIFSQQQVSCQNK